MSEDHDFGGFGEASEEVSEAPGPRNSRSSATRPSRQELCQRLARMDAALRRAVEGMKAFRELAFSDPLTGLHNRRYFESRLEQEISRVRRRPGSHFSVLAIDLNGFKRVNDSLGHQAGDEVLKKVARFLEENLRTHDICCRTGGDEFMLILPEADASGCATVVNRLRDGLAAWNGDSPIRVGLSIGAAIWPDEGSTASKLIEAADAAMYEDKRHQRGLQAASLADRHCA